MVQSKENAFNYNQGAPLGNSPFPLVDNSQYQPGPPKYQQHPQPYQHQQQPPPPPPPQQQQHCYQALRPQTDRSSSNGNAMSSGLGGALLGSLATYMVVEKDRHGRHGHHHHLSNHHHHRNHHVHNSPSFGGHMGGFPRVMGFSGPHHGGFGGFLGHNGHRHHGHPDHHDGHHHDHHYYGHHH